MNNTNSVESANKIGISERAYRGAPQGYSRAQWGEGVAFRKSSRNWSFNPDEARKLAARKRWSAKMRTAKLAAAVVA
jgi:hypothetical protein